MPSGRRDPSVFGIYVLRIARALDNGRIETVAGAVTAVAHPFSPPCKTRNARPAVGDALGAQRTGFWHPESAGLCSVAFMGPSSTKGATTARLRRPATKVMVFQWPCGMGWLVGANLNFANLSGANLHGAFLINTMLMRANLSGAVLSRAILGGANLAMANLSKADLSGANLSYANLTQANLNEANLREAILWGAQLVDTNLTDADLTGCRIHGVSAWN